MVRVKIDLARVAETTLACVSLLRANDTRTREKPGARIKPPKIAGCCSVDKWHKRERERECLPAKIFAVTKRGQPEYRLDDDVLQRLFVSLTRNVEISLSISIGPLDTAAFHLTVFINITFFYITSFIFRFVGMIEFYHTIPFLIEIIGLVLTMSLALTQVYQ